MRLVHSTLGAAFFRGRYNIGFWHWELPEFPDSWLDGFKLVDEVWAPTEFVVESISRKSPVPVVRMPHAIQVQVDRSARRADFGLPDRPFLFLTMYDTHSFQARKNPAAVIEAFRQAFPNPGDVGLVVKINNPASKRQDLAALRAQLADVRGVTVIDRILTRQEVNDLENLCDCYVSLHRSEGFGLGLAESMYLGKPVIGTDWSGNRDFMDATNSCPVRCSLVRLDEDHGPYNRGQVWADPDIEHAAWYMRRILHERAWAQELAQRGQDTIRSRFSPQAVGRLYAERLSALARLLGSKLGATPMPRLRTRVADNNRAA
jgi:glycosyltransferase involved in cell wall biosynthesis